MRHFPQDHWIDQALGYAEVHGWSIIPVYPFVRGNNAQCSCGNTSCTKHFLHPRVYRPYDAATRDEQEILEWSERWTEADLAVLTGPASGIIALRADSRGQRALGDVEECHSRLPTGPVIDWLDDTRWYVFEHPGRPIDSKQLATGLRLIGDNEFVRLPPYRLRRRTKSPLRWIEQPGLMEPQPLPGWWWQEFGYSKVAAELSVGHSESEHRPNGSQSTLPFQRLTGLSERTEAGHDWVVKPWLAEGSMSVLAGPAKLGGKSTFARDLARSVVCGQSMLDQPTQQSPVLLLSEDPASVVEVAYAKSGFLGHPDAANLHVLPYASVQAMSFSDLMAECREEALRIGARLIVIDSLQRFAQLDHLQDLRQQHVAALDHVKDVGISVLATASFNALPQSPASDTIDGLGRLAMVSDTVMEICPPQHGLENRRVLRAWSRMHPASRYLLELRNGRFHVNSSFGALFDQPAALESPTREGAIRGPVNTFHLQHGPKGEA